MILLDTGHLFGSRRVHAADVLSVTRKIERVFRDHRLSAYEIALDTDVRLRVEAEFPPVLRNSNGSDRLSESLKNALRTSEKSMYQIAQDAGIAQIVLSRFLSGERDIRMATADRLAEALRLKLAAAS